MIQEVLPDVFLIEVPIPNNPLQATNAYLIRAENRSLMVDTGLPLRVCKMALLTGIKQIGVDLRDLDYFITHIHGDHAGLVNELREPISSVYCSEIDAEYVSNSKDETNTRRILQYLIMHGFPPIDLQDSLMLFEQYFANTLSDFTKVKDGDVINVGEFHFRCVSTPGHSPGHMCLYEEERKMFIGGDHILKDISPNITGWPERLDSLQQYLLSLEKLKDFDIEVILPGHRGLIYNVEGRIDDLIEGHRNRMIDVLTILNNNDPMNAYQVAGRMNWQVDIPWHLYTMMQKLCATGEAISHLEYLVKQKLVQVRKQEDMLFFSLC